MSSSLPEICKLSVFPDILSPGKQKSPENNCFKSESFEFVLYDRHATSLNAADSQSRSSEEAKVNQARADRLLRITPVPSGGEGGIQCR